MATVSSRADLAATAQPLNGIDTIILAGGLGTRLSQVLPRRQKVLADVDGKPFLGKLIDFYAAAGSGRIVLALGYRSDDVEDFIRQFCGATRLIASVEPEPRGTAGALRHALALVQSGTVLVANGDSFADVDLAALIALHRSRRSKVTIALAYVDDVRRYGRVLFEGDGGVVCFEEKPDPASNGAELAGYINAGIYLIEREVIATLPGDRVISLERDVFPPLIGGGLYAFGARVPFIDIGTPESWSKANDFFAEMRRRKNER